MAAASFTERFDFRTLEHLDDDSAERALVEPALALNVRWEVSAARAVLASGAGSPYLIRLLGDETWTLANPEAGLVLTEGAGACGDRRGAGEPEQRDVPWPLGQGHRGLAGPDAASTMGTRKSDDRRRAHRSHPVQEASATNSCRGARFWRGSDRSDDALTARWTS